MIPQITEVKDKFPEYATLSQATVTLNDMGDKTISTQIKIDGGIVPDFSFDWEVEFQGEQYIHPLREPQASKGNDSICSLIDLTFYHKTIYDLKRYYFPKMAEVSSGTASVDKYIADLNVNLEQFKVALQEVLDYYHKIGYLDEPITVKLYREGEGIYAKEAQYVQIQYTHIWDVVQKIYDLFGVRWSIEGREIKIGYPTEEVAHTFEYGFEGGLLKVERQVQSADIRNSLLGRGSSENLPHRYFKGVDKNNPSFEADPDAIPELANVYFSELRGKTFRDYVQGWKTNPNRYLSQGDVVEEYDTERGESPEGWAYKAGHEDETFNPIEYVEDKDSIAKYGLLQGGLPNYEEAKPSIQGVEIDGIGRVDEVVGVEEVLVDEITNNSEGKSYNQDISFGYIAYNQSPKNEPIRIYNIVSDVFRVPTGYKCGFISSPVCEARSKAKYKHTQYMGKLGDPIESTRWEDHPIDCKIIGARVWNASKSEELITDIVNLPSDVDLRCSIDVEVTNFYQGYDKTRYDSVSNVVTGSSLAVIDNGVAEISVNIDWTCDFLYLNGIIIGNYIDGYNRKFAEISIKKQSIGLIDDEDLRSDIFEVPEGGATNVDVPINIIVGESGQGLYEFEKTVKAVNVETNEIVSSINIPQGKYYLRVMVEIRNNSTSTQTYKVELLPTYIYFPTNSEEFKPKFDIWIKNIWNTSRNDGESAQAYADRVWLPILGNKDGDEAKVVFSSGLLSGHSDWEFAIVDYAYAGGEGVEYDKVEAEWRLTLAKTDAEIEASGKWIPSTQTQAKAGDYFFLIGIDMPHQYVLWAEEKLDQYKRDQLLETAHIKPTWVVQTDKVRLNQLQEGESELLLNALKIGNSLRLADTRFTNGIAQTLYLQSVTYTWQEGTNILPDVEVVLSDKVATSTNPVAKLQGEVDALTRQVGSISNIQQIVRVIGDKLYLRKDGVDEVSNSATEFNKLVSSRDYRQGAVGGKGWGLRSEQGKGIIEVDKLIVRDEMQVNSLVVNQVSAIGGKEILSAASIECTRVDVTNEGYVCYFDRKRGSIANLFQVNDIAYSQVFSPTNNELKYYKREVVATTDNTITLSLQGDGEGSPQVGDVIAQYGNTTDLTRQYVIIRDVIGGGYERMLSGLNSVSATGDEYYFAGRLEGGTPRWFVGDPNNNYAKWENGELEIKGKVHFEAGSSGLENLEEIDEAINNALADANIGGQNLLRNSGFTGDYLSERLADDSVLDALDEMYNSPLVHWEVTGNVTTDDSTEAVSGKMGTVSNGALLQNLWTKEIVGESYVLTFKAKGTSLRWNFGGKSESLPLTSEWDNHTVVVVPSESRGIFRLSTSDSFSICDLQLEKGSIATEWKNSPFDNASDRAYYQSLKYLNQALEQGSTDILGGLVLTNYIKVGNYANHEMTQETGGMQGSYANDDSPFLWGGGTNKQAVDTISKYKDNPSYRPTEDDLADMAKFVVTHGGRAILNDIILRGYIYALGGELIGSLRKAKTTISDSLSFLKYATQRTSGGNQISNTYTFDLEKVGNFVEFKYAPTSIVDNENSISLQLPSTSDDYYNIDYVRSFIGTEVLIYNANGKGITLNFCNGTQCIPIFDGECLLAKCTMAEGNAEEEESIIWDFTKRKIKS